MSMIRIDDELQRKVTKIVEKNKIEFPSIKNFVDKAIVKFIDELKKQK